MDRERFNTFLYGALSLEPSAAQDLFEERYPQGDPDREEAAAAWLRAQRRSRNRPRPPELEGIRINSRAGSGAYGVVYRATQLNPERVVAVKVLDGALLPGRVQRFQREVRLLTALDHPNIVKVHLAQQLADGRPAFVMEYAGDFTITAYARNQGLAIRQRVGLLLDACHAASYAHQREMLHRDLKPANILVNHDGKVRVVDFGLARFFSLDPEEAFFQAVEILPPYSPGYSSPEMRRGEPVSASTDVYSLGAVLQELLTDQPPPESVSPYLSRPDVGAGHGRTPLSKPVDPDLAAVAAKATAVSPGDRYASCADLARDLQNWLDLRPVAARSGARWHEAVLFGRRNWQWTSFAAVLLLALFASWAALWKEAGHLRELVRTTQNMGSSCQAIIGDAVARFAKSSADGNRELAQMFSRLAANERQRAGSTSDQDQHGESLQMELFFLTGQESYLAADDPAQPALRRRRNEVKTQLERLGLEALTRGSGSITFPSRFQHYPALIRLLRSQATDAVADGSIRELFRHDLAGPLTTTDRAALQTVVCGGDADLAALRQRFPELSRICVP